jgi:hypothetical protein
MQKVKRIHFHSENSCECEVWTEDKETYIWLAPNEFEIMQSTGCFDANNKEIFESDILVSKEGSIALFGVTWNNTIHGYSLNPFDKYNQTNPRFDLIGNEYLIKGNYYEKPELIK